MNILSLVTLIVTSLLSFAQADVSNRSTLHFYGRVNHWADSRSDLVTELDLMQQVHVDGYMIELSGWGREQWTRPWLYKTIRQYRWLLRQCRRRDIQLFVSVVNDNMGLHKYGDTGTSLAEVEGHVHKLVHAVKRAGHRGVFVQPVAETRTDAGKRIERYCRQKLRHFTLVYNGDGGFPKTIPDGFIYRAVHPAHINTKVPADAFVVSDHGLIIRELNAGGSLDGLADSTKLAAWVATLHQSGVPAIGYYVFQHCHPDTTAIKVLGEPYPTK